jgi:hypothetical protein
VFPALALLDQTEGLVSLGPMKRSVNDSGRQRHFGEAAPRAVVVQVRFVRWANPRTSVTCGVTDRQRKVKPSAGLAGRALAEFTSSFPQYCISPGEKSCILHLAV